MLRCLGKAVRPTADSAELSVERHATGIYRNEKIKNRL